MGERNKRKTPVNDFIYTSAFGMLQTITILHSQQSSNKMYIVALKILTSSAIT